MRTGQQLLIPEKGNGEVVSCLFAEATNNVLAGDQANVINDDSLAGSLSGPTESSGPDRLPPPFGSSGVDNDTRSVGLTPPREHGACTGEASEGELPLAGCNSPPAASLPIPSAVIPDALSDERRIALDWMEPIRNKDGTGRQLSRCLRYEVRKTIKAGVSTYWAWANKKLLGYVGTPEAARQLCQKHADG